MATHDGLCEVTTISFWDSMDAVRAFVGEDPSQARFYLGDDDLLVEKDLHVNHYEIVSADLDTAAITALPR